MPAAVPSCFPSLVPPQALQLGCRGKLSGWCCNGVRNVTNDVAVWGFCKGSDSFQLLKAAAKMVLLCSSVQLLCHG